MRRHTLHDWAFPLAVLIGLLGFALTPAIQSSPQAKEPPQARFGKPAEAATPVPMPLPTRATLPPPRPPLVYSYRWLGTRPSPDLGLHAASAVLVDLDTNEVLWQNWPDSLRAPASLTKLMTIMVALDHAPLQQLVMVPAGATDFGPDASTMGLEPGNVLTVRELIYGILLASANDAAETLAQGIIPRAQFIAEMNAKARKLGLGHTHFSNPTGLDAPDHFSSAMDLAVITGYFADHFSDLLAISSLDQVTLYQAVGHPEYDLVNLNKLITWPYPGATGLKTGYTDAAGGCVAATAERDGRRLAAVVLGSDVQFTDASKLFDYGWTVDPR